MLLKDLFEVFNGYPSSQVIVEEQKEDNHIPYIRPSSDFHNVVAGYVNKDTIPERCIFPPDTIFVSTDGQGSHTYSYVSNFTFVPNSNVAVLIPKRDMNLQEKIFYSICITKNRYKFSYGRKPKGDRLLNINIPENAPDWVAKRNIDYSVKSPVINQTSPQLDTTDWKEFIYTDIFEIKKGKRVVQANLNPGKTPFIGAIDSNNGVREYCDLVPLFSGNVITVPYNGNGGVGEAFYQPNAFWASDDINVLYPKFDLNPYIAIFLISLIRKERYRFNYGRKWHKERMEKSIIKLPVDRNGKPDWAYMEKFIKTLPYSNSL
ncbi:restriction endonuclease subunit S [Priestia megaterium]|uniref:restriction endonuclease subunit S n=1 Tax=Priestia megaterium TaxID=1404 RepID=UPI002731B16E|nr:restriction endonuclease subunit S [Priestia megaterium]MDP1443108.1 restriction endonuclease subunit S [Priestia megaterium]MDP1472226.1 restriction endonuclease subunit S [Priestia megaterium]